MKNKLISAAAAFLFAFALSGCRLITTEGSGGNYTVKGTVTDKDGNALSGVKILIDSKYEATTASDGTYTVTGVPGRTLEVTASKAGMTFIAVFAEQGEYVSGDYINIGSVAQSGVVYDADFTGIEAGSITISDIQGSSGTSPLKESTVTVTGVVTMICHKAPHWNYDTTGLSGADIAQYVSEDGFYLEALPEDKDYSGKKSNGIFIDTHDEAYEDSSWVSLVPTDLEAGDVVTVTGIVKETSKKDRYDSNSGLLTRTIIKAQNAFHRTSGGQNETASYPDGVLLTYSESKAEQWEADHSFTKDGVTYTGEARIIPHDSDSSTPMQDAINVLETVEDMVIVIDEPRVVGASYYNTTGVLADNGKIDGEHFRTYNETWQGDVICENPKTGVQDFNEEILFVDYQATDYKAYACNLAQIGDVLTDQNGDEIFRGVMDYTGDGLYMAHPLNTKLGYFITDSNATGYLAPYYINDDEGDSYSWQTVSGKTMYNQLWSFDPSSAWYYSTDLKTSMTNQKSANSTAAAALRLGTSGSTFDAMGIFTPAWKDDSSTSKGNTDSSSLTVASFNLENYEAQGSSNSKDKQVALTIKNNLLYPDVMVIVEMGDDVETEETYSNQNNSWAAKDGSVSAVKNYCDIIDQIKNNNGPQYDFRQIDPKEQDSGGEAGVNIRVGLIYNTERMEFIDSGIKTNNYYNTHGNSYSDSLKDSSEWPLQTPSDCADALADAAAKVYADSDGVPHLVQNPCYIQDSSFSHSRRPLVGEFKSKVTGENVFVIACHLSSKRSDYPLYGQIQPPLLLSESGRNRQAQAVNSFVKSILSIDKNAKIIVAGDMNDFAYSTPLRILTGQQGGNPNQILWSPEEEFMDVTEQFSYAYEGNLQEIDHIFVSKALFDKAYDTEQGDWKNVCFIPHIDSMFTRNNHYNLSDHDPAVIHIKGVFNESN